MPALATAGLLALAAVMAFLWFRPEPVTANGPPSIAVLPFEDLSDGGGQGYLVDGFAEGLTTELARVPGLFVVSRKATLAYRGTATPPAEIAAALGVRYLLEGSIRRAGDDMRISAQLIDTATTGHIWAERFDGSWSEVFALQDRVVTSIAGTLKLRLVAGDRMAETAGGTIDPQAYEAYLRGWELVQRKRPQDIVEAVRWYERALALDRDFGMAAAALAWLHWDADDQRAKALGLSWAGIEGKIYENLELAARNPSAMYYQLVADLLVRERRSDEAIALLQKAVPLDPSDPWTYEGLSQALIFSGRPAEGRAYLDAAIRVDPGWNDWRHYQGGLPPSARVASRMPPQRSGRSTPARPIPGPSSTGFRCCSPSMGISATALRSLPPVQSWMLFSMNARRASPPTCWRGSSSSTSTISTSSG